jgi:hypothetical protein
MCGFWLGLVGSLRHSNPATSFLRCLARHTHLWWCYCGYWLVFSKWIRLVLTVHSSIFIFFLCSISTWFCNFTISYNLPAFPFI